MNNQQPQPGFTIRRQGRYLNVFPSRDTPFTPDVLALAKTAAILANGYAGGYELGGFQSLEFAAGAAITPEAVALAALGRNTRVTFVPPLEEAS